MIAIGRLDDFAEDAATPIRIDLDGNEVGLLILRKGGIVRVYEDICPHLFLPLTYRSSRVLSEDGTKLRCSNHSAEFDALTGQPLTALACEALAVFPLIIDSEGVLRLQRDRSGEA